MLAARAASSVTGQQTNDVGIRMESMIRAGLTGPIGEALAMYYQVQLLACFATTACFSVIVTLHGWNSWGDEQGHA